MIALLSLLVFAIHTVLQKLIIKYLVSDTVIFSFYYYLFAIFFLLPWVLLGKAMVPLAHQWPFIAVAGLLRTVMMLMYMRSLRDLDVSVVSPMFNLRVIFVAILEVIILGVDLVRGSDWDLMDEYLCRVLLFLAWGGYIDGAMGGPPCSTWSAARWLYIPGGPRPLRMRGAFAWGLPNLRPHEARRVAEGSQPLTKGGDGLRVCEVGALTNRVDTFALQLLCGTLRPVSLATNKHHRRPLGAQPTGDREADAPAASGHQGDRFRRYETCLFDGCVHSPTVLPRPRARIPTSADYPGRAYVFACERNTQWPVSPLAM